MSLQKRSHFRNGYDRKVCIFALASRNPNDNISIFKDNSWSYCEKQRRADRSNWFPRSRRLQLSLLPLHSDGGVHYFPLYGPRNCVAAPLAAGFCPIVGSSLESATWAIFGIKTCRDLLSAEIITFSVQFRPGWYVMAFLFISQILWTWSFLGIAGSIGATMVYPIDMGKLLWLSHIFLSHLRHSQGTVISILLELSLLQLYYINLDSVNWLILSTYHVLTSLPQHANSAVDSCWPNALQK